MSRKSHEGDRRGAARFEVIGRQGANLTMIERLTVLNLSQGGLLVETTRPLNRGGIYTMQLESKALVSSVQARVVRLGRSGQKSYEAALEFVAADAGALATIREMLQGGGSARG